MGVLNRAKSSRIGRSGSIEPFVYHAARCVRRAMLLPVGGKAPRSFAGWERLCQLHGIDPVPLYRSPTRFRARLIITDRDVFAFYNRHAPARMRSRWLAHEIAEKLALGDLPSLFDELPMTADYTGEADPYDIRHRIARRVEELCFRGV